MNRILTFFFASISSMSALAQSQEIAPGDSVPWEFRKQAFIYGSAKAFNDPVVAKMAIFNLLSENPGNIALYDSLAYLYLQYNQISSAALAADYALKLNPNNLYASEIAANAYDQLGFKDKAIAYYESLYLKGNDLNTMYKISFLQMEIGRYEAAKSSADIIIGDETSKEQFVYFPSDDGQSQKVPLYISALRVKAMVEQLKENVEVAKALFLEILKLYPGFQIVQKQLYELSKSSKPEDGKKE